MTDLNKLESLHQLTNLKTAIDASFIIAITDPKGNILEVNDKFCEISGYSRAELLGQNHRIINSGYHPASFFVDLWKTISSGRKWEGEIRNRAKDGSFYWVHTVIVPFMNQNGKVEQYVSIRYDITAKKEQQINSSALLESAFDALLIYNLSGRIVWANQVAVDMFSLTDWNQKEVYVGEKLPSDFPMFIQGSYLIQEKKDNRNITFEISSKNYLFKGHRAYLVACRDVSERENLQAQILQQDRLASIGLLASGLAHEIGTPLGIMRGRAELLGFRLDDKESLQSGLNIIIQQIDRISKLIHSLLGLARGTTSTSPQPTDLFQVCEDVVNLLAHEGRKNDTEILNQIHQHTYVMSVSASLFQVLLNLTVNSLHAIQERKKTEPELKGKIQMSLITNEDDWTIQVEDNGCGINEENMAKIFNPFFTTKDVGKGTGLGLATSYRMIQSWGGSIEVQSEVNEFTRFRIHLKKATMAL